MDTNCSYNKRYKPLLKLIFENCNNDENCKYKIYQSEDNIDHISMKLSCISKFIERLVKIVKSGLDEDKQIQQIQRFKDHTHKSIFNEETSEKILKLMRLFINPEQIKRKKHHVHHMKHNPVYNRCMSKILEKPIHKAQKHEPEQEQVVSMENRDHLIQHLYESLNPEELGLIKQTIMDLNNASSYTQQGGAKPTEKVSFDDLSDINNKFFKELFSRISTKIQEDKIYGTLDSIVDYKKRLEAFVRESVQDMDVPDHLRYFVDNVNNLVDAIYPSNILDFVRSDDTIGGKIENEFAEPFELTELVLFALSVMPIPVINLIPDFMLIVHNLMNGKRIMFTILSSVALIIKICTLLFFDLGPILKMYYLSKKIKNFNMNDLAQVMDKTVNDILTLPGGISQFGTGIISKAMLPLASAGQLRPENMSIQLGNNNPISGTNPMGALQQMSNIAGSNPDLSSLRNALDNLKTQKKESDSKTQSSNIQQLQIDIALLQGKINHREDVLKKYTDDEEYKKTWKSIDPNRENRMRAEIGDLETKLNNKQKELNSKKTDQEPSENTMVETQIKKLDSEKKVFERKEKENVCKAKESDNVPEFAKDKQVDCSGVAKRVAAKTDKAADSRLKSDFYKNKNKISEIDFQLIELRKINANSAAKTTPKANATPEGNAAAESAGAKTEESKTTPEAKTEESKTTAATTAVATAAAKTEESKTAPEANAAAKAAGATES
jgi:hypothetical protein